MRALLLRIVFGRRATARGVTARAIEDALRSDEDILLTNSQCKRLTAGVMRALDRLGYRF